MCSNKKRSSADSLEYVEKKKKKKRKASDKERKRLALEPKPKPIMVSGSNSNDPETAASSFSLLELPLNYFRDLTSPDASVREAAATFLVSRLQEIQKQYETLPDKESIDGGLMFQESISVESLLKLVSDNLCISSSMKGQFCGRVFRIVSSLKVTKSLLKGLGADGQTACETALGDLFLSLKNTEC